MIGKKVAPYWYNLVIFRVVKVSEKSISMVMAFSNGDRDFTSAPELRRVKSSVVKIDTWLFNQVTEYLETLKEREKWFADMRSQAISNIERIIDTESPHPRRLEDEAVTHRRLCILREEFESLIEYRLETLLRRIAAHADDSVSEDAPAAA